MNPIKLKVSEAIQDDVDKGIVRRDYSLLKTLGIKPKPLNSNVKNPRNQSKYY